MRKQVHGILLLDKPINMTSNGALQRVKRLFNAIKAGHTGSLDPIATGMLPICFGEATKFSQFLLDSSKTYYVEVKLGEQTNTGDTEGEVVAVKETAHVNQENLNAALKKFLGKSSQIPPMFSAIKHQGQPLYRLARRGIQVERKPREITIFSIELNSFNTNTFTFTVHCSKGTYVRTLVEDICKEVGCCGHVKELRRLAVAPYGDAKMYSLNQIEELANKTGETTLYNSLLPIETAVQSYPLVKLTTTSAYYLRMGQAVRAPNASTNVLVRLMSEDMTFLGVGEVLADGRVKPHRLVTYS